MLHQNNFSARFVPHLDLYDNLEREQALQAPSRALERYLPRPDYDEFYPVDYKKRSMHRKRGELV